MVTKAHDWESYVKMYSMQTQELAFEEKIGGQMDQYIKCKEVEQSPSGQLFALCYFNDGLFRVRIFDRITRSNAEIEKTEIKVNEICGIDNYTMVN
jgi:hypothetical protein